MSNDTRKPIPVNEETIAVDSSQSSIDEVSSSENETNAEHMKNISAKRKPGLVSEQSEAIVEGNPVLNSRKLEQGGNQYWSRLFWALVILFASWLTYRTVSSLLTVWHESIWLGGLFTIATVVFVSILLRLIWREYRSIKSIDQISVTRGKVNQYIVEGSVVGVHETLKPLLNRIKINYPDECHQFDEARHERETVNEYLSLLENVVLSKLDKDVDNLINKSTVSVGALVAISPHPSLDAVIIMIRVNILLRKISTIYGLELTGLSSLYLFKQIIMSAVLAAGVEEAGTILLEQVSAGLTEKFAKITAEGMVSASRVYRLANYTKKITRTIADTK